MPATLGLRIKTGFAIAMLVEKRDRSVAVTRRQVVALSTPDVPESGGPYHPALDLPDQEGATVTRRAVDAVRRVARKEMTALLASVPELSGAAMVVGSLVDPGTIANPHIRAHALEGALFREVVGDALDGRGVRHEALLERDAYEAVGRDLRRDPSDLRREIDALGKGVVTPWRAEEKLATLAAWWQLKKRTADG